MASAVCLVVILTFGSLGFFHSFLRIGLIPFVDLVEAGGVYCLLKLVAIFLEFSTILPLK